MVTIILPIYNGERYLPTALESVRTQTYTDFECLCIDDGSSDNSADIVRGFAAEDSRFRLVQQSNQGVAASRNRGLRESKGQYITFLDQDDVFSPEILEKLLSVANETRCEVVEAEITEFYSKELPDVGLTIKTNNVVSNTPFVDFFGVGKNPCVRVAIWGKLYAKRSIEDVMFPDGVFGADDYVFTARLYSKISRYAKTDLRLYLYRMHKNNVTMQMPMRYIMGMLQSREIVWNEALKNSSRVGVFRISVCRRYGKDILSWAIKKTCRNTYSSDEMEELRFKVAKLESDGVFSSLNLRDRVKLRFFLKGYSLLLKFFFPSLFRKSKICK